MFCTNCGKEIDNGSIFCTYCGTRQSQGEAVSNGLSKAEPVTMKEGTPASDVPEETISSAGGISNTGEPSTSSVVVPVTDHATTVTAHEAKPVSQPLSNSAAVPKSENKKSNSSIVVIGIIAVAVIVALILLLGKGSGYKEYKDLVKNYYNAIYKEDFKALLKCYDKEDQSDLKDDKEDVVEELEALKERYDDKYDKGWNKKIGKITRTKIDSEDGVTLYTVNVIIDEDSSDHLFIKKYKNRYYIESGNDNF